MYFTAAKKEKEQNMMYIICTAVIKQLYSGTLLHLNVYYSKFA